MFVALLVHSTVSISSISKSAGYHDVHEAIPRMHTRSAPQCEVVPVILNVSPPRRYAAICNSTQVRRSSTEPGEIPGVGYASSIYNYA